LTERNAPTILAKRCTSSLGPKSSEEPEFTIATLPFASPSSSALLSRKGRPPIVTVSS